MGFSFVGFMYILDEFSIGLYLCDMEWFILVFYCLCDLGNMVIVVEYEEEVMCVVDEIVDIGFVVGKYGGEFVF